jgi:sedoheptulokinase
MLASGSALYGGAAYALLERFFRSYAAEAGFGGGEQYEILNRLALAAAEDGPVLPVRTTFGGTRDDPELKGLIADVTAENFTPGALAAGVLAGMTEELYGLYERIPHDGVRTLVLSGNAARKNPALQKIVKRVFGLDVLIPVCREEAALGAALFAADAAGFDGKTARRCLAYTAVE